MSTAKDGVEEFVKLVESQLVLNGRRIRFTKYGTMTFINFFNFPSEVCGGGGGAELENNRMMFSVGGFGKDRVMVEMRVSALPRGYRLRKKTGTPPQIAKYLSDFINKVVREVEPNFTHTKL